MQYNKFEFRDFNIGTVIRTPPKDVVQTEIDQIVTEAVVDALHENIGATAETGGNLEGEGAYEQPALQEPTHIDVDSVRAESYQNGYNDAKMHFEPLVKAVKEDESLVAALKAKLEAIIPVVNIQEQMSTLSVKALVVIAKKLHLTLPADFESIILGEMMAVLNKYYKTGEIAIAVNPEKVDYCQNLLKVSTLSAHIAENVQIIPEETIGKGDCTLTWNETKLEYSQERIIEDTDAILARLKI